MPGKNRIAFVIHGLPMGGAEKFLINLVNNFYKACYYPVVILLSDEKTLLPELNKEVKVVTIFKRSRYDLGVSKRIKNVIKEEGIYKIFCVNTYSFFLTKLAFLFDRKVKFYISLHSTIPDSVKNYWQNLIYLRMITKNDVVVYLCQNQKNYLRKKYYISPLNEEVIYNGIDTAWFNPELFKELDVKSLRQEYGLADTDKVIIKVARLYAEKDHFNAINAIGVLQSNYNNKAHLLLVGNGEPAYTQSLKDHAKVKGLEQYVHFAGNQSDVRKFYCIADVFTLTSYSIETFSIAALEAMAFGLPCSLTDIGGASEMTIEGVTGMLSKPKDILSIAASWNTLLNSDLKGERIRQYVIGHFTAQRMFEEYRQLIDRD